MCTDVPAIELFFLIREILKIRVIRGPFLPFQTQPPLSSKPSLFPPLSPVQNFFCFFTRVRKAPTYFFTELFDAWAQAHATNCWKLPHPADNFAPRHGKPERKVLLKPSRGGTRSHAFSLAFCRQRWRGRADFGREAGADSVRAVSV